MHRLARMVFLVTLCISFLPSVRPFNLLGGVTTSQSARTKYIVSGKIELEEFKDSNTGDRLITKCGTVIDKYTDDTATIGTPEKREEHVVTLQDVLAE